MSQASEPNRVPERDATATYPPTPSTGATTPADPRPDGHAPAAPPPAQVGRCRLLGEIARGGMGAILRAYDPELGRELAVKVLLECHQGHPDAERRFLEEAQIAGQLQHPGIAPVYDVGRLPDRRPFFTMKLVEGRTLADLLKERESPARDLPRFLKIFEQVCQATAYAHSRGVIHRDLKPSNVMVGAFGEVQVMDWGLAKVLKPGDVQTIRSERPEMQSQAGSVLGTPSYMAPEQACGDVEGLDVRCDVFGLGAILCEVLTGWPPYRGRDKGELLRQAARADLADARARLVGCGADAELVRLAEACLAPEPADRPADAGAAAEALGSYLTGVQERLRQAELARAAAQAKAAEERKRRRLTLALAATLLLAVVGAGAVALWVQRDRAARAADDARRAAETERDVTAALDEAAALGRQAKTLSDDPARWEAALAEALSAVKRADGLLKDGGAADELRARVDATRRELEAADRDRRMVARLEEARLQTAEGGRGGFDYAGAAALYAAAFKDDGTDLDSLDIEKAAEQINGRAIRDDLLAGLEDWAAVASDKDGARRLTQVVQAVDPDPASLRNRCPALIARKDWDGLRRLAFGPEGEGLSAAALHRLGRRVRFGAGGTAQVVKFLKEADGRRPGDFWINFELGYASANLNPPAADEAIRYYTAAIALRPRSAAAHNNIGGNLRRKGLVDEAIAEFRKALQLNPYALHAHHNLGLTLDRYKGLVDEAIAEYGRQIEVNPQDVVVYFDLGTALKERGRFDEARTALRRYAELRTGRPAGPDPAAALQDVEALIRLDAMLPAVLAGTAEPSTPAERLRFADVCRCKRLDVASARLCSRAFADEPALADGPGAGRSNAARVAALAGCGQGEDAAALDDKERGRWRAQAQAWLRAELDIWSQKVAKGGENDRSAAARTLQRWRDDADLADVRDADALAKLPAEEREGWRRLWADVEAGLKKAQGK